MLRTTRCTADLTDCEAKLWEVDVAGLASNKQKVHSKDRQSTSTSDECLMISVCLADMVLQP